MGLFYKHRIKLAVLSALVLLTAGCNASTVVDVEPSDLQKPVDEWATFRGGIKRQGVAFNGGGLPPYQLVWQHTPDRNTNGFVDWGAVVRDGVLYTPDGSNRILALDALTGDLIWERGLSSNSFAVTLVPDQDVLLVTTAITTRPSPTLYALKTGSGKIIWENTRKDQPAIGGIEGPPVVEGDAIYVGYLTYNGSGGVCRYDLSGTLIWHQSFPGITPLSPLSVDEERVYVGLNDKRLYALDKKTGELAWSQGEFGVFVKAAPVVIPEGVVIGEKSRLILLDAQSGAGKWEFKVKGEVGAASPVYDQGRLYVVTTESQAYAVNASDGQEIWQTGVGAGRLESSPVLDKKTGLLYFGSNKNRLIVMESGTGKKVSEVDFGEAASGNWKNSPVVLNGWIYIGSSDKSFYALSASKSSSQNVPSP